MTNASVNPYLTHGSKIVEALNFYHFELTGYLDESHWLLDKIISRKCFMEMSGDSLEVLDKVAESFIENSCDFYDSADAIETAYEIKERLDEKAFNVLIKKIKEVEEAGA
ncbi:hypothetical protein [Franzmannia qiaohouensis]|uniref:Uncharacterized protein n=1 Tax=Franzmannia qiaohouensis TaxID=1329370 RepID=A0ABU1HDN9_9GAMM|nr:hypothetical protein [Halomonas qiaohouensis]MDR5904874.1 hypothetical protein [Halomonas qiaohouensis]